jgi:hypothetical protein
MGRGGKTESRAEFVRHGQAQLEMSRSSDFPLLFARPTTVDVNIASYWVLGARYQQIVARTFYTGQPDPDPGVLRAGCCCCCWCVDACHHLLVLCAVHGLESIIIILPYSPDPCVSAVSATFCVFASLLIIISIIVPSILHACNCSSNLDAPSTACSLPPCQTPRPHLSPVHIRAAHYPVLLRHTVCLVSKTATPIASHSIILASPYHHYCPVLFAPARSFISHSRPATLFITAYHTTPHSSSRCHLP